MNLGVTDWYQSLTYPDEYIYFINGKVVARFNHARNLYANFDYRNYPVSTTKIQTDLYRYNS